MASDRQPILGVILGGRGIHGCVRPEIGHAEGLTVAFEPVAQNMKCSLDFQLLREVVQHGRSGFWPEESLQRPAIWRVGSPLRNPLHRRGNKGEFLDYRRSVFRFFISAGIGQFGFNRRLESTFGMARHGSYFPVRECFLRW